jgi:hypothetical protein
MIENKYNCPLEIWRGFTQTEQEYYNLMKKEFEFKNHVYYLHPDTNKFIPEEWSTLTHNMVTMFIWRIFKAEKDEIFYEKTDYEN